MIEKLLKEDQAVFQQLGDSKYDAISISSDIDTTSTGGQTKTVVHRNLPAKTKWDKVQLLILPVVLTLLVVLFNLLQLVLQGDQFTKSQQLQRDQFVDAQRLALDQQRQTLLTTYLDRMSDLMPALHASTQKDDPVRISAQAQTIATLQQLDPQRRRIVLLFLYGAGLISVKQAEIYLPDPPSTILQLKSAELSNVNLSGSDIDIHGAFLREVKLHEANLSQAHLYDSNLYHADLSGANLSGADLNGAYLEGAHLRGAILTNALVEADLYLADLSGAQLNGADLKVANLEGANLSQTNLHGAKYNTIVVKRTVTTITYVGQPPHKEVSTITYELQPTQWPQGFDPARAGAIVDNTDEKVS